MLEVNAENAGFFSKGFNLKKVAEIDLSIFGLMVDITN